MAENNYGLYIVAVVAIIAVFGLVIMVNDRSASSSSPLKVSDEVGASNEVEVSKKIVDLEPGEAENLAGAAYTACARMQITETCTVGENLIRMCTNSYRCLLMNSR